MKDEQKNIIKINENDKTKMYETIDGTMTNEPIGYCASRKKFLTLSQFKREACIKKKCAVFFKVSNRYWRGENKFKSRDGSMVIDPIAYCRTHKCYLTLNQMKLHKCTSRGCDGLVKLEHEYWDNRRKMKQEAKKRKQSRG